jgi:hypothetical protein
MRTAIAGVLLFLSSAVPAAEFKLAGDQLIISGLYDDTELARVRDFIKSDGERIRTVVLRDLGSRGVNNIQNMILIAGLFTERGWRTAVSGFCNTTCFYLFLGGVERQFTDDRPGLQTRVAIGGTVWMTDSTRFTRMEKDKPSAPANSFYRSWMKQRTGGKLSDELLDKVLPLDDREPSYLQLYDASRLKRSDGVSVIHCPKGADPNRRWLECAKIAGTDVYREGIVTSKELLRSNDR